MTMFNARVDGARAEDGKVIFDVDVGGQKSAPWTYKEFPKLSDLWGMNIHTSGEERDHIANAVSRYALENSAAKRKAFELAQSQTILLSSGSRCLRCAQSAIRFAIKDRTRCSECGAWYALSPPPQARAAAESTLTGAGAGSLLTLPE